MRNEFLLLKMVSNNFITITGKNVLFLLILELIVHTFGDGVELNK